MNRNYKERTNPNPRMNITAKANVPVAADAQKLIQKFIKCYD